MLLAITSEGKLGLGLLAGLFIVFALLSSFYFPRRNPDFPGDRLGLFALVTAVLFAATMAGVVFFAKEEEEAHGAEVTETQGTETGEAPTTTEEGAAQPEGDAAAGEAVFAEAGCGGCHTLEAAGSSGTVGPNLDESQPDLRARGRPGHERRRRHAGVRRPARRDADSGRGRVRGRVHTGIGLPIPCAAPGEVSERPKERDWKSRTRRKACRGFKSRPLRCGCFKNPIREGRVLDFSGRCSLERRLPRSSGCLDG